MKNKGGIVKVKEPYLIGEESSHCFFPIYTEGVVTTEDVKKAILEKIEKDIKLREFLINV